MGDRPRMSWAHCNPTLMMKFNAHINVEVVAFVAGIKYLFKYVSKGKNIRIPPLNA